MVGGLGEGHGAVRLERGETSVAVLGEYCTGQHTLQQKRTPRHSAESSGITDVFAPTRPCMGLRRWCLRAVGSKGNRVWWKLMNVPAHHKVALDLVGGSPAFSGAERAVRPRQQFRTEGVASVPAQEAWWMRWPQSTNLLMFDGPSCMTLCTFSRMNKCELGRVQVAKVPSLLPRLFILPHLFACCAITACSSPFFA
jgi:hypothetical protein